MSEFSYTTKALYSGEKVCGMDLSPETIPCFLTTAFTMRGFKEVQDTGIFKRLPTFAVYYYTNTLRNIVH